MISALFAPVLFRLSLGRWPRGDERRRYAASLRPGGVPLPPLVRGMLAVPDGGVQISRLLLIRMMRDGRLPPPDPWAAVPSLSIGPQMGDPLSFWEGRGVSFLHLEKTAGTALVEVLTSHFHPLQIDIDPTRAMPAHLLCPFALGAVRERKLVWGHYDLPALRRLGAERMVVTMLREPKARLLSLYHYYRSVQPALVGAFDNYQVRLAHELDLLGFLRCRDPLLRDMVENVYVRRLTGAYASHGDRDPLEADPGRVLAEARLALSEIEAVGVVERMEASLRTLSAALGVGLPPSLPARNVGADNPQLTTLFRAVEREEVTAAVADELDRLTSLDRVIYDECLRRLQAADRMPAA